MVVSEGEVLIESNTKIADRHGRPYGGRDGIKFCPRFWAYFVSLLISLVFNIEWLRGCKDTINTRIAVLLLFSSPSL